MPYNRQHDRYFHSHARTRTRPSSSPSNGQNNSTSSVPIICCKFVFYILLCGFTSCLVLSTISLLLLRISISSGSYQRDASSITAFFVLAIAIILCKRSCRRLKQYSLIINTRRQLRQRLHEQQELYNLALPTNNDENPELVTSGITDLPSYKELFPSHLDISNNDNDPSPPPSYENFMKRLAIHHPVSSFRSSVLSIPTTPLSSTSPSRCIWITDQTQRPVSIPGTITYL